MKQQLGIAAAVLVVLALATWWFLSTYERVPVEVPTGYRGEARVNPYYAAEVLLQHVGYDADSYATFTPSEWLPSTGDTLVMRASASTSDDADKALLARWVAEGGHLVLLPPLERTLATDELVETFGFRLKQVGPSRAVDEPLPPRGRRTIELGGYTLDGPLEPWRFERIGPLPPDLVAVADGFGMFVARRPYGDGFVTVVADGGIFTNPRLARADHARLFLDAVAGHIEPGAVWFVYSEDFPSLAALIWQNARYFVLGAALWTVLWLWSMLPRFGPLVSSAAPARRSILEHITAAARFTWRLSGPRDLVESAAAAVVRRAEMRRPGIARMPLEQQAVHIGRLAREPAERVEAALRPVEQMSQRDFTHRILELKKIRNEL